MKALHATREREDIPVYYQTPALALLQGDNGVEGVRVRLPKSQGGPCDRFAR